jgi:hypothetical protein
LVQTERFDRETGCEHQRDKNWLIREKHARERFSDATEHEERKDGKFNVLTASIDEECRAEQLEGSGGRHQML